MAKEQDLGVLIPKGGGDPIPLLKKKLLVGRRENCDIVLRFGNVSAHHCEMTLESGYWFVKDLGSRNGTRVNGYRVTKRRVDPNDVVYFAKLQYELNYSPSDLGAVGPPPDGGELEDILGSSLMDSAGLNRKARQASEGRIGRNQPVPQASEQEVDAETDAEDAKSDEPDVESNDETSSED